MAPKHARSMSRLLIFITIILAPLFTNAQDFSFGYTSLSELNMTKYSKDTTAHAVVLNEFGDTKLALGTYSVRLFYQYHVRIKFFDNTNFDKATVEIPLIANFDGNSIPEEVDEIRGVTIYKDDNGNIKTEELKLNKVLDIKEDENRRTIKFTMPALRKGCIIDYTYRFISPHFQNFHSWAFQSDIPKVRSGYEAHIPAFCLYNASLKGNLKLSKKNSDREPQCFSLGGGVTDCLHLTYEMVNIPAFVTEDFMPSPKNFMSSINFELVEYISPYSDKEFKVSKSWKDVDAQFKQGESYGGQLKKRDLLKSYISPIIAGIFDPLAKAKAVYRHIQKNIKWNGYNSIYIGLIRKTLDTHLGDAADINLALVASLNAAGLEADPVLLSTRDHGSVNKLYPVITEFNYLIALVTIGENTYLLDATDPLLPFGILPLRCLNDQGRVLSMNKDSYWINLPGKQKRSSTYMSDLTLNADGKITGKLTTVTKGYAAFEKRVEIKKFNSVQEYVEDKDEKLPALKINKFDIVNLDSLDQSLSETYEIEINGSKMLSDKLGFSPFLFDKVVENPFKFNERNFPVDLGIPSDVKYISTLHLPDGYAIETPPQATSFSIPGQTAKFFTTYESWDKSFTFSYVTQFSQSVYSPDEYLHLKDLFNKIILSEKTDIQLKKIN